MIPDRLGYFLDDISGTSKIWSKSAPIDLLTITKMLQTIQGNYGPWNHPGKILLLSIWDSRHFKMFEKVCPRYHVFRSLFFAFFVEMRVHILKIVLWRWGTEDDKLSIDKMYKSLEMNFISINNMKWFFVICTKYLLKT